MKRWIGAVIACLVLLALLNAPLDRGVRADTGIYLPVPSGIFSTGEIVVAKDANRLTGSSSLTLGASGTPITGITVYTPSLTPSSVGAATCAAQTYTVTGLTTADKVIVNVPSIATAVGTGGVRVSATNTLEIRWCNPTAGSLTPSAGTYVVIAIRS